MSTDASEIQLSRLRIRQGYVVASALIAGLAASLSFPSIVATLTDQEDLIFRFAGSKIIAFQAGLAVAGVVYWTAISVIIRNDRDGAVTALNQLQSRDRTGSAEQVKVTFRNLIIPLSYLTWLLPVSGFLGTVYGLSLAISPLGTLLTADGTLNAGAISSVLQGLNTAFDTTLVGLLGVIPAMALAMELDGTIRRRMANLHRNA